MERFAENHLVMQVERNDSSKVTPVNTRDATIERHFYTVRLIDGSTSTLVENPLLSEIEGHAVRIMRGLDSDTFPEEEDRQRLAFYIALLLTRGRAFADHVEQRELHEWRDRLRTVSHERVRNRFIEMEGVEPSEERVNTMVEELRAGADDKLEGIHLTVPVSPEYRVRRMLDDAKELMPEFLERPWFLMRFTAPVLLTGDLPLAVFPQTDTETVGWMAFPLDSMTALVFGYTQDGGRDGMVAICSSELAQRINGNIACQCYRWIFHHPSHNPLANMTLPPRPPIFDPRAHPADPVNHGVSDAASRSTATVAPPP